jgi:5'(3')-deoxyribonucleotidase
MIDPAKVAFDIDGVVADTMTLFIEIARSEYGLEGLRYEDITQYNLEKCFSDVDPGIINEIIRKLVDGDYEAGLPPIADAPDVLGKLARNRAEQGGNPLPLLFVTARSHTGPMREWVRDDLPLAPDMVEIVPTKDPERKAEILLDRGISHFVEDRLETCHLLHKAGITPVLFRQPWNREKHPFTEVGTWRELESLIKF